MQMSAQNRSLQSTSLEVHQTTPQETILGIISGFWLSRAVYVGAKLGIPDLLKTGPKTVAELAAKTDSHPPSLYRLLRALASFGVLREEHGRFSSTAIAALLESDAPGSLRAFAMTELGEEHYPAWEHLLHSVKTGEIAFDHHFRMPVWQYFKRSPENAAIFHEAMSRLTDSLDSAIVGVYDFSSFKSVADIGGGHGNLLCSVLRVHSSLKGVLFERPEVATTARACIEERGLSSRCEVVEGNFFDSVPAGVDAYLLKWIIHDWDDVKAASILGHCARQLRPRGRVLLFETVIVENGAPDFGKLADLNMLVMTGGKERTASEYSQLLASAGLRLRRILPTESMMSIIEATKA